MIIDETCRVYLFMQFCVFVRFVQLEPKTFHCVHLRKIVLTFKTFLSKKKAAFIPIAEARGFSSHFGKATEFLSALVFFNIVKHFVVSRNYFVRLYLFNAMRFRRGATADEKIFDATVKIFFRTKNNRRSLSRKKSAEISDSPAEVALFGFRFANHGDDRQFRGDGNVSRACVVADVQIRK